MMLKTLYWVTKNLPSTEKDSNKEVDDAWSETGAELGLLRRR